MFRFNNLLSAIVIVAASALSLIITSSAQAQSQTVVFVDADSPNNSPQNTPPGNSWGDAFKFLSDAMAYSASLANPLPIWVAAGTYKPDQSSANPNGTSNPVDRTATFLLRENVGIYGGFAGNEPNTPVGFRSRNHLINITILSGEIGIAALSDKSYHVVTANVRNSGILDGFTITRGNAAGAPSPNGCVDGEAGGGLLAYGGSTQLTGVDAKIARCTFIDTNANS